MLNIKPHLICSTTKFSGDPDLISGEIYSVKSACKKLRSQHPYGLKYHPCREPHPVVQFLDVKSTTPKL